jgi:AraC family transcriptional regulator
MGTRLAPGVFLGHSVRTSTAGDLTLADIRYTNGAARHHHERAYFSLIRRGAYTETFGRRSRVCRPGLLIFHPPGESHSQALCTPAVSALNLELGPLWLDRMREQGVAIDQPFESDDPALVAPAERLLPHLGRGAGAVLAIECAAVEILGAMARAVRPRDRRIPKWVGDIRDLVDADPARPPSLGAMARAVGVHPVYLAQAFRRFCGCSLGEYARRRRLDRARQQVAAGDRPLSWIASEAGFADQSHFTRTFKRYTGVTPRGYRTFLAFKTPAGHEP